MNKFILLLTLLSSSLHSQQILTCTEGNLQDHTIPNYNYVLTECKEIDYTVYVDYLYYQEFNQDTTDIINTINETVNLTNGDLAFYSLQLNIVNIIISKNASDDYWLDSIPNNLSNLLSQFSANVVGFSTSNDLVGLNTGFDLSGSVIGVAYLGSACGIYPTHVLENFNSNLNMRRNLLTHEIGHNLNASHASGGTYIMSPSVNGSTTWASSSETSINSFISGLDCFGSCEIIDPCEIIGYDTTYIQVNIYDTVQFFIPVYDTITTIVQDTIIEYIVQYDTITTYVLDTIINDTQIFVYDTIHVQLYDTIVQIVTINDTIIHSVYIYDTIYVYDTIFITDTILVSIQPLGVENTNYKKGIYDMLGRKHNSLNGLARGIYFVNGKLVYINF